MPAEQKAKRVSEYIIPVEHLIDQPEEKEDEKKGAGGSPTVHVQDEDGVYSYVSSAKA